MQLRHYVKNAGGSDIMAISVWHGRSMRSAECQLKLTAVIKC